MSDILSGDTWKTIREKINALSSAAESAANSAEQAALYGGPRFNSVSDLVGDTTLTYAVGTPSSVLVGQYVSVVSEGFIYEVGAGIAIDNHLSTAGGVKLYVVPVASAYNIKAFGAAGNDVVDDTAAILKAFSAATSGKTVVVPPGVFRISQSMIISSDKVALVGSPGSVIKKIGPSAFDAVSLTGNFCSIRGVEVDGNEVGWSGIFVSGSDNFIAECVSRSNGGCGILLDGQATSCARNIVVNNDCSDNGEIGIGQNTAPSSKIINNTCRNNKLEGITVDLPSYRSVVCGNHVENNCLIGGVGGIGVDQAYLSVINDNIVSLTRSGLPGITFQCNVGDTTYCTVSGNVFSDNEGGGIRLKKTGSFHSSFNTITGNVFLNNGGKTIEIDAGCDRNSIGHNQFNGVWPLDNGVNNSKPAGLIAFRVANGTLRANVTGDATWYQVPYDNELSDPDSTVSSGVFTAPFKGLYSFQASARLSGGAGHTWGQIALVSNTNNPIAGVEVSAEDIFPLAISTTILLSAGETVSVQVRVGGGPNTKVLDLEASVNECWFSGFLVR